MPLFNAGLFNAEQFGGGGVPPRVVEVGNGLLYPALRKAAITIATADALARAVQDAIDELNRLSGSPIATGVHYSIQRDGIAGPAEDDLHDRHSARLVTDVDFAAQRPPLIESANVMDSAGTIRYPL
jgi:hypothetical protein